jgi:hypothetical protein
VIENNELVLNLRPAIDDLFSRLSVPVPQRLEEEGAGRVALVGDASTLDNLSTVIRAIDEATPVLMLFALLGYVGTVAAAPSFNRGVVMAGCGVVAAGLLSLLTWRVAGWGFSSVLEDLTIARMIADGLLESYRWQSLVLVIAGILVVVVGDGRLLRAVGQWTEPAMQRASEFGGVQVVVVMALALAVLLLLF